MIQRLLTIWIACTVLVTVLAPRCSVVLAAPQAGTACDAPAPVDGQGDPTLLRMRDEGDEQGMRVHAWQIFERSLYSREDPAWEDWCAMTNEDGRTLQCETKEDQHQLELFAIQLRQGKSAILPRSVRTHQIYRFLDSLTQPRQFQMTSGQLGQSGLLALDKSGRRPARLFETSVTLLNPASRSEIEACYTDHASSQGVGANVADSAFESKTTLTKPDRNCIKTNPLPSDSIAVKTIWATTSFWKTATGPDGSRINLSLGIPLWQEGLTTVDPRYYETLAVSDWNTTAHIGLSKNGKRFPCEQGKAYTLDTSSGQQGSPYIPLGCFYSIKVTRKEWNDFVTAQGRTATIPKDAGGNPIYFILLGFHVTTKEIPDWTWQTFWWNGAVQSDSDSPFQMDPTKPGAMNDPRWSHYKVDATYGPPADSPATYSPSSVKNPYLEGPLHYGMKSNCLACHQFAFFPKDQQTAGSYFHCGQDLGLGFFDQGCSAAQAEDYCASGVKTDFLWSLADFKVPTKADNRGKPFDQLQYLDTIIGNLAERHKQSQERTKQEDQLEH